MNKRPPTRAVVAPSGMTSGPSDLPASGGPSTASRAVGSPLGVGSIPTVVPASEPAGLMDGTSSRLVGPLDVRCSYCGAQPRQPCRDRITRAERDGFHGSREGDPRLLKWRAWHGDRNASRLVPPL